MLEARRQACRTQRVSRSIKGIPLGFDVQLKCILLGFDRAGRREQNKHCLTIKSVAPRFGSKVWLKVWLQGSCGSSLRSEPLWAAPSLPSSPLWAVLLSLGVCNIPCCRTPARPAANCARHHVYGDVVPSSTSARRADWLDTDPETPSDEHTQEEQLQRLNLAA